MDDRGCLLVRPDRHIAWRSHDLPADPEQALRTALDHVLARPAAVRRPVRPRGPAPGRVAPSARWPAATTNTLPTERSHGQDSALRRARGRRHR
ncbi:hypothetical protein ACFWPV_00420 [Streptomyces uncialis]|uniref:aromatic-ring hydroxylase C-terminal domain-containing protein n=1 Tax=Streptomyces uncialis TaxID=1048205 RepID=UPI003646FB8F